MTSFCGASACCAPFGKALFLAWASVLLSVGCATVKASVGPDGTHRIRCGNGMSTCIAEAAKICDEDGYTIVRGVSRPKMLGGSSSAYRTKSEMGEIDVRCGLPEDNEEEEATFKLPPRSDEPIQPVEPAAPAHVCTPGATQTCVGPGACQGGQICLARGEGFGPCDCGSAAPQKAPERAPTAPPKGSDGPSTIKPGVAPGPVPVPGAAPSPTPLAQ